MVKIKIRFFLFLLVILHLLIKGVLLVPVRIVSQQVVLGGEGEEPFLSEDVPRVPGRHTQLFQANAWNKTQSLSVFSGCGPKYYGPISASSAPVSSGLHIVPLVIPFSTNLNLRVTFSFPREMCLHVRASFDKT